MWIWVQNYREAAVTLAAETASSWAVGSRGPGRLQPVAEGGRGGFSQQPQPLPPHPRSRRVGEQGQGNCCLGPPGGSRFSRRCPLRAAGKGPEEKGAESLLQAGHHGPGVSLDSSAPPGRELEAAGAQALPRFVFGASSAPFPPPHVIFPFPPSPHCSPRTVPTQVALPCHPLASPPLGSEGMVEVGRGRGALDPPPSPYQHLPGA